MSKYFVKVCFKNSKKTYEYMINDDVHFEYQNYYLIETAEGDKYGTPVMVCMRSKTPFNSGIKLKTIVKATKVESVSSEKKAGVNFKKVVYNDKERSTTVFWNDFDFTTVKAIETDVYSREAGFALCVLKKQLGNRAFADAMNSYCSDDKNYYFSKKEEQERIARREAIKQKENSKEPVLKTLEIKKDNSNVGISCSVSGILDKMTATSNWATNDLPASVKDYFDFKKSEALK